MKFETVSAYPLSWPLGWKRATSRSRSRFGTYYNKPSVAKAREAVILELGRMGVRDWNVIISTNLALRLDGFPRSNQPEPSDPGVAVYFKLQGKPTVLACDKWTTVGDNLWSIAKHVEALRGQERWGVGSIEQAFAGYATLMEKTEASCWEILGINERELAALNDREGAIMSAFRLAAKKAHPDAGGSAEDFDRVVKAKDMALQLIAA